MMWVYGTTASVNENVLATNLAEFWGKELQLKDGLLPLSVSAQRRTDLLEHGYTSTAGFEDTYEQHQGSGVPRITRNQLILQS